MKYTWIERHRRHWPVTLQCEVLGVSASGYFERQVRLQAGTTRGTAQQIGRGRQRVSDEALLAHIKAAHAGSKGEYGWPRIWKELQAQGVRVGKERVQKLMQLHGIKARGKRRFVVTTTDSKHDLPIAPNLLARDFSPATPNAVWAGDITYIPTAEGWLYLAAVIDLHSRPALRPGSGLEHAGAYADQSGGGRAAHGLVQAQTGCGADLPLRPWQPVLQRRVSSHPGGLRHAQFDEPQGQLLGQRPDREPVGIAESRAFARLPV